MRTQLTISLTCLLGLLVAPLSGCAQTGCQDSFRCSYLPDTDSETDASTSESDTDTEGAPLTPPPTQGFWGYTKVDNHSTGLQEPFSVQICAATAEQLADPDNPPDPADMICVTSAEDGSYALELEPGSYGLCGYICDTCILDVTGVVVERDWNHGPGGGDFSPPCPNG